MTSASTSSCPTTGCVPRFPTGAPPRFPTFHSPLTGRGRLDYVLWIQDLVDSTSCDLPGELDRSAPVLGLDVFALPSPSRFTVYALIRPQRNGCELHISAAGV